MLVLYRIVSLKFVHLKISAEGWFVEESINQVLELSKFRFSSSQRCGGNALEIF